MTVDELCTVMETLKNEEKGRYRVCFFTPGPATTVGWDITDIDITRRIVRLRYEPHTKKGQKR
jgi:hypothetical protein